MLTRPAFLLVLLAALLLGTASFFIHQSDYPLTYDEGDYWAAVGSGMWTNWTDADDISIVEFARMGLGAVKDPAARARLSDYIRSSGSTMFHRHYHPPLAFYPAIALRPFVGSLPLHWQLRLANLFWLAVWIAVLALLGWKYPEARAAAVILVPASSAWGMAVVGFNMHLPFGLLASLFFFCWYLYEVHGHTALRRFAQFFLAASFATVEYGMFVLFFILLWGVITFWKSGEKKLFLRRALVSAGWVLLFLAILWPAGVINLNLLKSWTYVMYIALFRLGAEPVAFHGWWNLIIDKWNANTFELVLLGLLLYGVLYRWRQLLRRGSLFTASGFILALLYLQINPTLVYRWYLFPAFAVGFLFFGHVVIAERWRGTALEDEPLGSSAESALEDEPLGSSAETAEPGATRSIAPSYARALIAAAVGIMLFLSAWLLVPEPDYSELKQLHRLFEQVNPTHMTIPRGVLPQLTPYFPHAEIVSYHDVAYADMSVADSIPLWRARGFVLVPEGTELGNNFPDGQVGGYLYFLRKNAK
ncbi:MAG: hypothetical protein IH600_06765 [Bacteroidetes bacterium]|nr:hypothetical protein [Bacteroidota bacterium]